MKPSLRFFTLLFISAALVSALPAAAAGSQQLTGAWIAVGQADDGNTTQVLFTFSQDGTLVASSDTDAFSAGHGSWEKVGGRTFEAVNVAFVYGSSGETVAILRTTIAIELASGGESFAGAFTGTVTALDGTVLSVASGQATGQRITVD